MDTTYSINWDLEVDATTGLPERHYTCGEWHRELNPHTGKFIWKPWTCKNYHTCPNCKARKQQALKDRITPLLNDPQIRVIVHNQDIKELNKEYPDRLHIPKENNIVYTIVKSDDSNIGKPLTREMVDEISACAVAPKGRRISGNLGKKPATPKAEREENDFPTEVTRRVFKYCDHDGHDIDNNLAHKIEAETIKETDDLDPKTADQVQDALYVREQRLIEVAARYDVEILFLYTESILVYESQINWQKEKNAPPKSPLSRVYVSTD